jgi:hypothetical protein
MNRRIALIIPYFGTLPVWFAYFARSVSHSSILDVLLFTDAHVSTKLPDNIQVHRFSLAEFSEMAARALSIPISLQFPYKICDFKPALAEIFNDYIRDYEFWAFGDMDLIYGDLDAFLNPLLMDADLISCRRGWISGSLCVLRNREEVNSLYNRSSDWQKVLLSQEYQHFDEMGGFLYSEVLKGADVLSLRSSTTSFTHIVRGAADEGRLRCMFMDLACEDIAWGETIIYDGGKLTRSMDGSAVMYVHYVCMKRRFFVVPDMTDVPDRFYIRKTGIYTELPDIRVIGSQEFGRIVHGSIDGARRLLRRYIS